MGASNVVTLWSHMHSSVTADYHVTQHGLYIRNHDNAYYKRLSLGGRVIVGVFHEQNTVNLSLNDSWHCLHDTTDGDDSPPDMPATRVRCPLQHNTTPMWVTQ